jgi:ferredoxin
MDITSLKLAYFSPTGTTRRVVQAIARGISGLSPEEIDLTRPHARRKYLHLSARDLLVVGVPVYIGRVPEMIMDGLRNITGESTPVVCVVIYGNREYEDALLELKDTMEGCGCVPVGGAAFIGEHSFSSSETPLAVGRPDDLDLQCAEDFGRRFSEKIRAVASLDELADIEVHGEHPYRGDTRLWNVDFIAVSDACTECRFCVESCPTGAIDADRSALIDTGKCITCCACIKGCPSGARSMKSGPVMDVARRLSSLYQERKEPELFL